VLRKIGVQPPIAFAFLPLLAITSTSVMISQSCLELSKAWGFLIRFWAMPGLIDLLCNKSDNEIIK